VLHLLTEADAEERARVVAVLGRARRDRRATDVEWMRERMDAHGCIDHAREVAHSLAGAARHEAELLYADRPDSRDRRFLVALPEWVLARR